jgi:hypothetical protein
VTKSMLEIKEIFDQSDTRFVLNRLFIDDYCCYLRKLSEYVLVDLAQQVQSVSSLVLFSTVFVTLESNKRTKTKDSIHKFNTQR